MRNEMLLPRKVALSLSFLALVLGLAGCATPAREAQPTTSATAVLPTATPAAPPTDTPVPTQSPTPFVPKATVKIASHGPLSGQLAVAGTDLMRAAELAVLELAGPLEELGYKIELAPYDDQTDIGVAVANAKDIVADPEILCGVGHYSSRIFIQAQEIYHQAGLAFVAPSTTAAFVTASGYLEVNRVVGRNDGQGAARRAIRRRPGLCPCLHCQRKR